MKHILKEAKISRTRLGDSGQTFLVKYKGKKYILRKCSDIKQANFYVYIYNSLKKYKFLPEIIDRDGKNLLFEFIKGRNCRKSDATRVAFQVGRICGAINKLKFAEKFDIDKKNILNLATLLKKRAIKKREFYELNNFYYILKNKIEPKTAIDANDVNPENFRLIKGKVYFVDIEAIKPRLKGQGIAKAFIRWFRTNNEREKFREGYNSVLPIKFLTDDYLKFCYFCFLVQSIKNGLKQKKFLKREDLKKLNMLLEGRLK